MAIKAYRVRLPDGAEVEVAKAADAKRIGGEVLYGIDVDAAGNPVRREYGGGKSAETKPAAMPESTVPDPAPKAEK